MAVNQQMSESATVPKLALLIRLIVAACRVRNHTRRAVRLSKGYGAVFFRGWRVCPAAAAPKGEA